MQINPFQKFTRLFLQNVYVKGAFFALMLVSFSGFTPPEEHSSTKIPVGFASDDLITGFTSPTSLEFGPDGRLYVSQQDGTISIFEISRVGIGDYQIDSTIVIDAIKTDVPNHDDDGTINTTQRRQVTGLMVKGTATNPILYVTSSDWRIKVGQDAGLDTNSGVITRFTWVGTDVTDPAGYWDKVDIVRGLVRSEENHAVNGMALDEANNILYVMAGGNCNKGAPSNNFGATPEYALSAAMLSIDLDSLENMPIFTDSRTNTNFIYDIPTLDDPSRINIDNTHPEFPYPSNHPSYNSTIDLGDPFGGNDGLNQGRIVINGPVQVYAPGFRNAYDVVFTSQNRIYSIDNGPNGGWGGPPLLYDSFGNLIGASATSVSPGDYSTNELQETGSTGHGDALYYVSGPGFYGGYPNPTRANPATATLPHYVDVAGNWTIDSTYHFDTDFPEPPVPISMSNSIESIYTAPAGALTVYTRSTNGIAEYTASNFSGALQGHLMTVSFNDRVYDIELNAAGDALVSNTAILTGFGNNPLDITTQGDSDIFPGTIWLAIHGDDKITVFEPNDYQPFSCSGAYSLALDEDGDGFTNADEIDNGTDPCSQGSKPNDYDDDQLSDLNDPDDDNDGFFDTYDPFAVDSTNGRASLLPINYGFSINGTDAIPGSLFGLGFTGLITNGEPYTPTVGSNYQSLYDEVNLNLGGATSKLGIENINSGDLTAAQNDQENGFQFGVRVDTNTYKFTASTRVESPFFLVNGNPITPINGQSMGLIAGMGDQDNYVKIVMNAQGGAGGIGVTMENNGVPSSTDYSTVVVGNLLSVTAVELYLDFDPSAKTVQPMVSLDAGANKTLLGAPLSVPASWFDLADSIGMSVGIISTSGTSGQDFDATWDYINVLYNGPTALGIADVLVNSGSPDDIIDLDPSFEDDDLAAVVYTVESNSGSFVNATINNNLLTLTYPAANADAAQVVIRATDKDGNFVLDTLDVTVSNISFPVEYLNIEARNENNDIILNWTSAVELNNLGFEVQMKSERSDDQSFVDMGFVAGFGTTNVPQEYQYVIQDQIPGTYVLRLKQIDFDGKLSLSERVETTIDFSNELSIFPNPTDGTITLQFKAQSDFLDIELYDGKGMRIRQLYEGATVVNEGQTFHFDFNDLAAGLYLIKVSNGRESQIKRMIKL